MMDAMDVLIVVLDSLTWLWRSCFRGRGWSGGVCLALSGSLALLSSFLCCSAEFYGSYILPPSVEDVCLIFFHLESAWLV